jgi:glycosyltransferase involved in cell wall biosynthesis
MTKRAKILFLSPYPHNIGPSQRFRFEQYLNFLSEFYEIKQKCFWNKKAWDILFSDTNIIIKTIYLIIAFAKRKLLFFSIHRYDIIFIHREVAHIGPPIFEWIIKFIFRKKIIYDFDDAIWHLNYSDKNKIARFFKAPWKVKYICKWSDKIIVGNEYLAQYAKKFNQNVHIIPTTIDTDVHKTCIKKHDSVFLTIGWTGTLTTLKQLELFLPVLKNLKQKYNFNFLIISNEKPQFDIDFQYIEWSAEKEVDDLCNIDIGIMPLPNDEWAKGKCGLKGLQYMALEIPTVMSAVGVNTEIIQDGKNGLLARNNTEWIEKLSLLINNKDLRNKLGKEGRKTVETKYSVKANKEKYKKIIDSLLP